MNRQTDRDRKMSSDIQTDEQKKQRERYIDRKIGG